ncbi:MAG TPA: TonB-dependent siderophore receptor [Sphingomicrobium sp.]|jgi:catecholate siderophore receptor|nr:TonB-dependent siderophore receptor [Sphingomicrobium sp.]
MTRSLLLAGAVFFAAAQAHAAEMADAADSADQGELIIVTGERTGYRAERIFTATRTSTDLKDVPQAISVIGEKQIKDQAMRSIADVLRMVPGAAIAQGEGHRDQIVLRGNNSTSDFFLDGLRDDVQYYRGLYNLDRVEVLKGPNAMIFGRGGGGGVINRVTKRPLAEDFARGSIGVDHHRDWVVESDLNHSFSPTAAARLNGVYARFDSFRDEFEGRRIALNPTAAFSFDDRTRVDLSYEFNRDDRVVDRGVPSRAGAPLTGFQSSYFGDPRVNESDFEGHVGRLSFNHRLSNQISFTGRLLYGDYDKRYRNLFPATAVTIADGVQGFGVEAYEDGTRRRNLISQNDLVVSAQTGGIGHTLLAGVEYADQSTSSYRFNGLFANPLGGSNVLRGRVNLSDPFAPPPVAEWQLLRRSGTDVKVAALYVQDQVRIGRHLELLGGLRFDRFEIDARNLLSGQRLDGTDELWSPRLAVIGKPTETLSIYGSYGRSYLPQSGDQFTSLDLTAAALEPERFDNYELGLKWNLRPELSFTAAAYQLDRTNSRAPGAVPGTVVLTGEQRSRGIEVELTGEILPNWQVSAGYALQDGKITRTTAAAPEGRKLPLFPRHQLSLWTRYDFTSAFGGGFGLRHQSKSFASISNAVQLPAFTRVDLAGYVRLSQQIEAQLNLENVFGENYFVTAHNDNNIMPGAPRTARLTLKFGL